MLAFEAISKLNSLDGNIALDETYLDIIKGLNEEQAKLALSTTRLSKTKQQQLLIDAGLSSLSEEIAIDKAKECIINAELNDEIKESIIKKIAEAGASDVQADGSKVVSREKLKEIILTSELNEEEKEAILVNLGYSASNLGLAATFKKLALRVWGTIKAIGKFIAMNPWTWIVMGVAAIAGLSYAFDSYRKKVRETAKEAKSSIDEIKSSYEDLSSSVNDIKTRYAELAQEVDNLGKLNQNAGGLNTEEYEEFLDLSNQLSELFPQLTKGYDDNGNAILNLSGNVDTIVGSLNNLVKVQKDLANQEILEKMPEVWDGYALEVNEYQRELDNAKAFQNSFEKELNGMLTRSENMQIAEGRYNEMSDIFDDLGLDLHDYFVSHSSLGYTTLDFSELSEEDAAKIERYWSRLSKEYLDQEQNAQLQIDFANTEMQKYIQTWFNSNSAYSSETDPEKNQIMQYLMSSFDLGVFKEKLDGKDWDEVTTWIEDKILYAISNVDNENVENAMLKLLSGDYDSIPELEELYNSIQSYFSPDDPIMLYFEANYGSLNDSYNSVVDKAALKFTGNINSADDYQRLESEKQALDKFAKENSINTQDEIAFWNQCLEESNTREEAMQKYLEEAPDMFGVEISSVTDSIEQLNTKLKPAMNSIESAWQDIFTENGFNLDEIDLLSIGDSIKSELDGLKELGLDVDYTAFEDFIRVLEDTESTEDDVRNAFDNLAQSVINAGVSGTEDFETLKDALEDLGVVNNDIIAFQSLIQNVDALTASGLNLAEATYEDIEAFANERVEAENATQAIEMLTYQKILNGLADMDTSSEVTNMLALAEKAGVTAEVIGHLTELEKIYQEVASGTLDAETINGKLARAAELKSLIESEVSNVDYEPEVLFKPKLKTGSGSGSGSGSPFDWSDLLDKEITLLEKQLDAGLIDFDTYLNKRLALIEQYYNEGKIAADEYYTYLEATYENQISIYDKVISAVTKKLNDQIEDLEKQKEVISESYSLQIEKIQTEIDLLQKEADKKKELADLERARWEAERARTQRTLKVK